jgi:DNA-binding MarR family transcriptional regulator
MSPRSNEIENHSRSRTGWTFLTNHSHVLICLWKDPDATLREVSNLVGITERAVQRIVADLEAEGYLRRDREGRRNRYQVLADLPLRHALESHRAVQDVLELGAQPARKTTQQSGP